MTQKQQTFKKHLIKNIQINKRNVFEDDDMRYDFMLSRFGKSSLTKMSIDELKQMLNFCLKNVSDVRGDLLSWAQKDKIKTLWQRKARKKNADALFTFIAKITKTTSQSIDDILRAEATKVIVALTKMK